MLKLLYLHLLPAIYLLSVSNSLAEDKTEFFEKRIRPILVDHCYDCHGPNVASSKLRLDSKTGWMRGGERGPVVVPGDPNASLLYQAVTHNNPKLKMPPPDSDDRLSEQQVRDLAIWIRSGAVDPRGGKVIKAVDVKSKAHWAFQPIREPTIDDSSKHPIDYFLDKLLEQNKFTTTSQTDARTLAQRATYDLHGLPPTKDQLKTATESYPTLIDRLLSSPRYGERWGRHWLDVARYSDAKDGVLMYGDARIRPFAYTYRDYVIQAFNADKPFDEFIKEQIAADQMGLSPNSPNLAAMGLLTLGRMFDRNPHDVIDDQIDVITRGFLGLTASCARCHDHKFDPIPTADYYSLYGVFASSMEPLDRPRISEISSDGKAYEEEIERKLNEIRSVRDSHYNQTLDEARDRTPDYLVEVATTEPDYAETAIFFLSLVPGQLRPQITHRWRKLIARRAFPDDPIFAPWHDMMQNPELQLERWRGIGVDSRIIDGLIATNPKTPEDVARAYGGIIRGVGAQKKNIQEKIAKIDAEVSLLESASLNLADVVAGGNGLGTGTKGNGIHPATGKPTTGEKGFVEIPAPDILIPVTENRFIDGVFVPKTDTATITSTGIKITDLTPSSGKTWDYFKYAVSLGSTNSNIDGVDYSQSSNWLMAMHANKGITFDLKELRTANEFKGARFETLLGHSGAKGESQLDFSVYVDGERVVDVRNFPAQGKGRAINVKLPESARFLTLVTTEGAQGISHDQAILGNPRIVMDGREISDERKQKLLTLKEQRSQWAEELKHLKSRDGDPIAGLLLGGESPVWFPKDKIYYYLSRKQKDAFRGLKNEIDAISVRHNMAADRAMIMIDQEKLYEPVIFQRGDSGQRGNPVPRQFLQVLSGENRAPFENGSGRLELASKIASPDNPLTARVWVNRVWMHHFGEPLVDNPSDFGLRTNQPVQHELLDFLSSKFIENGWRTKPLHRLIMTSAAYSRSSTIGENQQLKEQLQLDSENKYLWRGNRRRMDLEQMRDTLLLVSGKIDWKMYGRPLLITDPNNHRRTVYAFVERQNLPDLIQTFDFANADASTARRVNTTVPQQALFAMNSKFVSEHASSLAERTAAEQSKRTRIKELYSLALGREPTDRETDFGIEFLHENGWNEFAHVLLMTNEFMFID